MKTGKLITNFVEIYDQGAQTEVIKLGFRV